MPGGSKKGGGLTTKKSAFYLKSGNNPPFKQMGSSPLHSGHTWYERTKGKVQEYTRDLSREVSELAEPITSRVKEFSEDYPTISKTVKTVMNPKGAIIKGISDMYQKKVQEAKNKEYRKNKRKREKLRRKIN